MILAFLLILIVFGFRLAFRFKLVVSLPAALELGFLGDWEAGGLGFFLEAGFRQKTPYSAAGMAL